LPEELQHDHGALIFASLAEVYIDSGMIDEAINILKDGLMRNPSYSFGHFLLGKAYYFKGDLDAAQKKFEEAVTQDPKMVSGYLFQGNVFRKRQEYPRALEFYVKALELSPNDNEIRKLVAEVEAVAVPAPPQPQPKPKPAPPQPEPQPVIEAPPVELPKLEELKAALEETLPPFAEPEPGVEELPPLIDRPKLEPFIEPRVAAEPPSVIETPVVVEPPPVFEMPAAVQEAPPAEEIPIKAKLDQAMAKIVNLESVKGALVITKDGLLIGNYLKGREDAEENAAMVAAIYNEANSCFNFLEQGQFERGVVERKDETIYIFVSQEAILSVLTSATTKPGLIFTFCGKVLDELRTILE